MTVDARWLLLLGNLLHVGCIAGAGSLDRDKDGVPADRDCDDEDPSVAPGLPEVCGNGIDDDCDGIADGLDTGVGAATFFADRDGDGYGDPDTVATACSTAPVGFVGNDQDCDDSAPGINPGRVDDTCDGIDDNCDDQIDEDATLADWYADVDGDGFGAGEPVETCDPEDGWVRTAGDCDDADAKRYPGATEICNGLDDNCVGGTDEGLLGTGPACAADSCAALYDAIGRDADGFFWLDGPTEVYDAECDVDDDHGGGWLVVDMDLVERSGWVSFETGGAPGAAAAWDDGRTSLRLDPGGGDVCASNPRWSLAQVELPEPYTELRGSYTLAPHKPTSTLPHIGLDNDLSRTWFRAAPRCIGTDYRGSVLFGNGSVAFKPAGLSDDWSGVTDTETVFTQPAPMSTPESSVLLWQIAGNHPNAYTGGRITQFRVYVR